MTQSAYRRRFPPPGHKAAAVGNEVWLKVTGPPTDPVYQAMVVQPGKGADDVVVIERCNHLHTDLASAERCGRRVRCERVLGEPG